MRNVLIILAVTICAINGSLSAQAPQKMSYQAVVRSANNTLVVNQNIGIRISILQGSATGASVYTETQTSTTNANGLISIAIGGKAGFESINWANGLYFILTEIDPTGGTNYTITGSSQLLTVPYAFHAKTADNGFSGDYLDLKNRPTGTNVGDLQYWDGTKWIILPRGIVGQILVMDKSNIPSWQSSSTLLSGPSTTIQAATNVQHNTATLNGVVNANNMSTTVGFEWGLTTNYGNIDYISKHITGNTDTPVSLTLDKITYGSTYHYRIVASNAVNETYSNDMTFTTPNPPIMLPTVTTSDITKITKTTATGGGNVTDGGGVELTARGVCWSTTPNPTIESNKTVDDTGLGLFTSSLSGLTANTTYYIRAYASNVFGTSYGNEVNITTTSELIGSSFQGGKIGCVFHLGDPGYVAGETHGLVVRAISAGSYWSNQTDITTGATGTSLGTGLSNTETIVKIQGFGDYAAQQCYDLDVDGYNDWYLPSKDELQKIYENNASIDNLSNGFWSSSEVGSKVWSLEFGEGQWREYTKSYQGVPTVGNVYAVRTF